MCNICTCCSACCYQKFLAISIWSQITFLYVKYVLAACWFNICVQARARPSVHCAGKGTFVYAENTSNKEFEEFMIRLLFGQKVHQVPVQSISKLCYEKNHRQLQRSKRARINAKGPAYLGNDKRISSYHPEMTLTGLLSFTESYIVEYYLFCRDKVK